MTAKCIALISGNGDQRIRYVAAGAYKGKERVTSRNIGA